MSASPVYVLDANVFIEAARRYYAFDLAPKFWESLKSHAQNGRVKSIDRVKVELNKGKDQLKAWANSQFGGAFASTDEVEINQKYGIIMNWVQSQGQFYDYAKAKFAKEADGWLIAYAMIKNCILVTHEVFSSDVKSKVPIPNVCQNFNVSCVDTFEMLRALSVRFD